jgi:phosphatidylglycerophosphate synthase
VSYPDLPFDPTSVSNLRRKVQKPYVEEEFLAWLLYRRVSIYVTLLFSRIWWITPNMLTALAVGLAAASSIVPWFVGGLGGVLMGAALMHVAYFFDLTDGELARLSGRYSQVGVWLDRLITGGISAATISLGTLILNETGWGFFAGVWVIAVLLRIYGRRAVSELNPEFKGYMLGSKALWTRGFVFFATDMGFATLLLIAGFLGLPAEYVVALHSVACLGQIAIMYFQVASSENR